jgi:D-alanyl-D-alanine carboxypeptidase
MARRIGPTSTSPLRLGATFALAVTLLAATGAAGAPRMRVAELRGLLSAAVAAGVPGVAARLVDGRGVAAAGAGMADLASGRRMRPGLHYRIGSVTKSFVATVVLQLVGEGRMSLDDTVERWLPGILPYDDQVTVRQLLNHTGGVPEYVVEPYFRLLTDPERRFRVWTPAELVALVAHLPPSFPPGSAWSYSNTDYVLAGMIVEAVTGNALGDELRRRIFRPLRLRGSSLPSGPTIPRPYANGYAFALGQAEGPPAEFTAFDPSLAWAAGGIVSDLDDLQKFFRALLRGKLLPAALLAEMKTPVPTGQGYGYGLGIVVIDTPSGPVFGHSGAIPGFRDAVLSSADGRRQLAIMMNAEFASPAVTAAFGDVTTALTARLFGAATSGGGR